MSMLENWNTWNDSNESHDLFVYVLVLFSWTGKTSLLCDPTISVLFDMKFNIITGIIKKTKTKI